MSPGESQEMQDNPNAPEWVVPAVWEAPAVSRERVPEQSTAEALAQVAQHNHALEERLAALHREHNQLQQAVYEAAQVQRKLCAPREMRRGLFEISSEIFPVRHLSGDFCVALDVDGACVFGVGDIAGKGLNAGLWLAHLIGLVRIYASSLPDLTATAAAINDELCDLHVESPMAALFLLRLDPRTGEIVYCNAGQPPALLLRREGTAESLQVGGPLLGAIPRASFTCGRIVLAPGDTLIAYSDGIVECCDARNEEFGVERLLVAARDSASTPPSTMLFSLLGAAQDFLDGRQREDDLTLMVVRRLDSEPANELVRL